MINIKYKTNCPECGNSVKIDTELEQLKEDNMMLMELVEDLKETVRVLTTLI